MKKITIDMPFKNKNLYLLRFLYKKNKLIAIKLIKKDLLSKNKKPNIKE